MIDNSATTNKKFMMIPLMILLGLTGFWLMFKFADACDKI